MMRHAFCSALVLMAAATINGCDENSNPPPAGAAPNAAVAPSTHGQWTRTAVTRDGTRRVWWRIVGEQDALPDSDPFDIDVVVEDAEGHPVDAILEVDAEMPHHGHGMNVRPTVERTGEGQFRVRGLLLHMPGRWEVAFDLGEPDGVVWRRAQESVEAP